MFKLIVLFISVIYLFQRYWNRRRKILCCEQFKNSIRSLPIFGHTYLLIGNAEKKMETLQAFGYEALKQGGVTAGCSWILDYYYLVVADPVVAETVLKNCLEKDDLMKLVKDGPGLGLVTSPVPEWRPRRKILNRIFNLNNLNKFVGIFNKNNNIMVEEIKLVSDMGPFPIHDYVTRCSLDSVCETFLGTELGAQKSHRHPLKEALNICFDIIAHRTVSPWLYSNIIFDLTPQSRLFKENSDKINTFISPLISEKLNHYYKGKSLKTMLQIMIDNANNKVTASQEYLQEEIMAVIVGATKPAPGAFSFVMMMMALHPDVQDNIYKEITEVIGDITKPTEPEHLPRLKYMEAVIKETLRLYPPVPIIAREIDKDLVLPDGKILVKGVGVFINIWAVHRSADYWGEDAKEFRPDRFLKPLTHPAAFLGFSYGVRNCLGFQYAIMSLTTSITSVLRQFRVTLPNEQAVGQKPLRVGVDLLLRLVDNLNVQLISR